MSDINEQIAKLKGEEHYVGDDQLGWCLGNHHPRECRGWMDYRGSIAAAWELVEELGGKGLSFTLTNDYWKDGGIGEWVASVSDPAGCGCPGPRDSQQWADTAPLAICLAYLAVKEADNRATCPACGALVVDLDGFGILSHDACGYCSHSSRTGDRCDACGEVRSGG